jgi:hypothetical protein
VGAAHAMLHRAFRVLFLLTLFILAVQCASLRAASPGLELAEAESHARSLGGAAAPSGNSTGCAHSADEQMEKTVRALSLLLSSTLLALHPLLSTPSY